MSYDPGSMYTLWYSGKPACPPLSALGVSGSPTKTHSRQIEFSGNFNSPERCIEVNSVTWSVRFDAQVIARILLRPRQCKPQMQLLLQEFCKTYASSLLALFS